MTADTVEDFEKKVRHYEESLYKVLVNLKKTPKARISQSYLKTKRMLAETAWSNYDTAHSEAFIRCDNVVLATLPSFASEARDRAEENFVEIMEWIDSRSVQPQTNTSRNAQSDQSTGNSQPATAEKEVLKSLSLPKFDGNFTSWLTFHDMFVSLVHDSQRLSKVQKLQYLKAATAEGEAEGLLAPYAVTEANYDDAWNLMLRVYNNKRLIVDGQLDILFGLKPVLVESATELKHLIYGTDQVLKSLKNSGVEIQNWDYFIIHMSARKLPSVTRNLWEQEISGKTELPTFEEFLTFVEKRYRSLMVSRPTTVKIESSNSIQKSVSPKQRVTGCAVCHSDHEVDRCSQFVSMSTSDRWKFVKRSSVCFRCLKPGHKVTSCKVGTKCMYCSKLHHAILHESSKASEKNDVPSKSSREAFHTTAKSEKEKVFATVLVNAKAEDGEVHTLRGVLDPTSNSCFVTTHACKLLKSEVIAGETTLTGLGGKPLGSSSRSTVFGISSIYDSSKICDVTALVVQSVSSKQPSKKLENRAGWEGLKELQLADPMFNIPGDVDLLLDVEVFSLIIRSGLIKIAGGPNAHETSLGWIVLGVVNPGDGFKPVNLNERGDEKLLSAEDVLCEKLFTETTYRKEDGRFVVELQMKEKLGETCKLGESRKIAYSRFNSLESRLKRDSVLCEKYKSCISDYFELSQIKKSGPPTGQSYYIPHHAVNKAGKFRVVFDASCKTDSGVSLNDCMYAGPKLQTELWVVINNWRKHRFVFQSDIEKMYRQVEVCGEDADRQRVLWRPREGTAIEEFQLLRLTFGVKAAPFLAIRTLQLIADEVKDKFPRAQHAIRNEVYVDDLRSGDDTVEGAVELRSQISEVLEAGKFPLRKWVANDNQILEGLPFEHLDERGLFEISDKDSEVVVQSLGLLWDPKRDVFRFQIKEISWLKKGKELRSEGETCKSLAKLNPFVDAHGVLRVGGRIRHSRLSFNKRHPMILPRDSHLARLVIRECHESTLHGGVQEVLNYVRQSFWLIGGRNAVQSALATCVNCNRVKARMCTQIMADLPSSRISSEGQTFVHCGLDYAGPLYCRASTLRNAKRLKCYVALFICFSSKAVNLQLVTDKTTDGFMKAFARFTSLRGKPSVMYSDNEKAFVAADRVIQRESSAVFRRVHEEARDFLANEGITWLFNPPVAPHQGWLWESNIKSMKRHLFASIGNALLTYEELSTVLARIEACLNSRPLCAMTEDPEDLEVLTPGHFLIGRSLLSVPESSCVDLKDQVLSRWRYLQKLSQTFWNRWSDEYLNTLQTRNKWVYKSRQLQVGDLVLLREDMIHPLKWRRGRTIEAMVGKDTRVRVIKIKTMNGVLIRDVRQVCLLSSSLE